MSDIKHLGDITQINGYTVPIVDCAVGGSPCQDLSIAGKREGLAGERSGLFMHQVRIVKEMREHDRAIKGTDDDIRPRFLVWENVAGAFSSNKGEDFRIVLEEIAKIADETASIPRPEGGKWRTSGCIMGRGFSIAWRVLDAQYWGTPDKPLPQRRRRIALVADFGGASAPEILFVRDGLQGHFRPSLPKGKRTSRTAESCAGVPYTMKIRSGVEVDSGGKMAGKGALIQTDKSGTLSTVQDQHLFAPVAFSKARRAQSDQDYESWVESGTANTLNAFDVGDVRTTTAVIALDRAAYNQGANALYDFEVSEDGINSTLVSKGPSAVAYTLDPYESNAMKSSNPHSGFHETDVAKCLDTSIPNPAKNQGGTAVVQTYQEVTGPLMANSHPGSYTGQDVYSDMLVAGKVDCPAYSLGNGQADNAYLSEETARTLNCMHDQQAVMQYVFENHRQDARYTGPLDVSPTLPSKMGTGGANTPFSVMTGERYIVRRLTPLECERLQGFPDGWTDIGDWVDSKGKKRKSSDAARYKALGNSIALPPWKWVLKRICAQYERDATLASLFDGIGGFPLIWEQYNGKGSCLWASEIDEFPMAVTKVRFGGE